MKNLTSKNNLLKILIAVLVSIFALYYLIIFFNWKEIIQSLQKANIFLFFIGSFSSLFLYFFFRGLRWYLLLQCEKLAVSFIALYLFNTIATGFSTIITLQSGEVLKVEYLKKYGANRFSGYGIFILERFLDLLVVVGLGIVGISLNFNWNILQNYLYIFAGVLFVIALLVVSGVFLLPFQQLQPLRDWLRVQWESKYSILLAFILTLLSWLAVSFGWYISLKSVSVDISILQSIVIVSLTTLLSIISFVPGAVGVSELSISTILIKMGISNSLAQTGAIAIRLYALVILVMTFFHWIILRLTSKKLLKE